MVSHDFSLFYYLPTSWLGGGVCVCGGGGHLWDKEIGQRSAAGGTGRCLLWAAGVSLSGVCARAWPLGSVQARRGSAALTEVWSGLGQQPIINLARVTMGAARGPRFKSQQTRLKRFGNSPHVLGFKPKPAVPNNIQLKREAGLVKKAPKALKINRPLKTG